MANWQVGDLKVRGKVCDIARWLIQGTKCDKWDRWLLDVNRTYLEKDDFSAVIGSFIEDVRYGSGLNEQVILIIPDLRNAWGITDEKLEQWVQLSKKYHLDFRYYGFESGMQFEQDMIIENGQVLRLKKHRYENYKWESIRPSIGG